MSSYSFMSTKGFSALITGLANLNLQQDENLSCTLNGLTRRTWFG